MLVRIPSTFSSACQLSCVLFHVEWLENPRRHQNLRDAGRRGSRGNFTGSAPPAHIPPPRSLPRALTVRCAILIVVLLQIEFGTSGRARSKMTRSAARSIQRTLRDRRSDVLKGPLKKARNSMKEPELTAYVSARSEWSARKRRLWKGEQLVPLTPKAFETLLALVKQSGTIIDKDDLLGGVSDLTRSSTKRRSRRTSRRSPRRWGGASDQPDISSPPFPGAAIRSFHL